MNTTGPFPSGVMCDVLDVSSAGEQQAGHQPRAAQGNQPRPSRQRRTLWQSGGARCASQQRRSRRAAPGRSTHEAAQHCYTTNPGRQAAYYRQPAFPPGRPKLLQRQFATTGPNRVWLADLTSTAASARPHRALESRHAIRSEGISCRARPHEPRRALRQSAMESFFKPLRQSGSTMPTTPPCRGEPRRVRLPQGLAQSPAPPFSDRLYHAKADGNNRSLIPTTKRPL